MQSNFKYYSFIFGIGAVGYCFLELLWRGFTHPSMALAGGLSFLLISVIQHKMKRLKFIYRCVLSGLSITAVELVFGLIFNVWLGMFVWDYSLMPLNFLGQICFLYAVLWCFLSAPALIATDLIRELFGADSSPT